MNSIINHFFYLTFTKTNDCFARRSLTQRLGYLSGPFAACFVTVFGCHLRKQVVPLLLFTVCCDKEMRPLAFGNFHSSVRFSKKKSTGSTWIPLCSTSWKTSLNSHNNDGQENSFHRQKRKTSTTTTILHVYRAFWYISLLHDLCKTTDSLVCQQ